MKVSCRWIVGPRYDLTFFIGSCAVTWVFLALYHGLRHFEVVVGPGSVLCTYFIFTAVFDHPHIFQTFSRTHADADEFQRHRWLHTWGLAAFLVGGVAVAAAGFLGELIVFAAIFGSWHIIRQHWGLLRAYKARNGDRAPLDDAIDGTLFYSGMFGFLLEDYTGIAGPTEIFGGLHVRFPSIPELIGPLVMGVFVITLVVFVWRQLALVRAGRPVNVPKVLFLVAAIGTHGLVFWATATPFLVGEALETSYHNVQYQGWVMHYRRRRFGAGVVLRWFVVALAYGLVVGTLEVTSLLYQKTVGWVFLPFFMVVVYHYYVDGKVWRLGSDATLRDTVLAS